MIGLLVWIGPIVVGVGVLPGLYQLLPNGPVRFRSALAGAITAFPLWLIARWAFALYVENVGRQSIYGAIGLVPLFLMWLNASWWIFLFGAQLAHAAANLYRMQSSEWGDMHFPGSWDLLATVVAIAQGNAANAGPVPIEQVAGALSLSQEDAELLTLRLSDDGIVCRVAGTESTAYLLARPPERINVSDILQFNSSFADGAQRAWAPEIVQAVRQIGTRAEAGLEGITIAEAVRDWRSH